MTIQAFTIRLCFVLAYLVLALPLPAALLDHELGLLGGDPAHTVLDDHAWLDHAAGAGGVSEESACCAPEVNASAVVPTDVISEFFEVLRPSVRGPPPPIRSRAESVRRDASA